MKKLVAAFFSFYVAFTASALAQSGSPVKQSGNVTQKHVAMWTTSGVIQDGGTAAQGFLSSLGVTAQGPGICQNSDLITAPGGYQQVCLGVTTAGGAAISLQNYGGAPVGTLSFMVNGATFTPVTAVGPFNVGGIPCFSNTTGNLIDCGLIGSSGTITTGVWGGTPIDVAHGGTGATAAPAARSNLGLGSLALQNSNAVTITGGSITGMPTPINPSDVAIKSYVDSFASGISFLPSSLLATTAALSTNTYANGTAGVGATLTATANGALTVDSVATASGNIILVKNESSASHNGIYTVTATGDGSDPYVLTRATYFDTPSQMVAGAYTLISSGTVNSGSSWVLSGTVSSVGTTSVAFNKFGNSSVTGINGVNGAIVTDNTLAMTGQTLGVTAAATGVVVAANYPNVSAVKTNTTGTISSSSSSLALASALDFSNGQGIRINHAGTANGLGAPSALTITPTGTTGSATYTYTIAPFTATGGYGPAISVVTTSSGNASLGATNYNALSWAAASGSPAGYAVYGNTTGSMALLAFVPGTTFNDLGSAAFISEGAPDWMPGTPPVSGAANWLVTSVSAGSGTTTLTLAATASTTATTQGVYHDDTAALQAAFSAALTANQPLNLGGGTYRITSPLTGSGSMQVYGNGPTVAGAPGSLILTSPTQDGFDVTATYGTFRDFSFEGGSASSSGQVGGSLINFLTGSNAVWVNRVSSQFSYNGLTTTAGVGPAFITENLLSGRNTIINFLNGGDSYYGGNTITVASVPGATSGVGIGLTGNPGGAKILGNKINGADSGYVAGISITAQFSDGDVLIDGNSIESFNVAGLIMDRSGSTTFGNITFNNNQIAGIGTSSRGVYLSSTAPGWLSLITVSGNIIQTSLEGINIVASDSFNLSGNVISGSSVGIRIGSGATGCMIGPSVFKNVGTQIVDSSAACVYSAVTTTQPVYP